MGDLGERIGSTCSGTGAAVSRRVARRSSGDLAASSQRLRPDLGDVSARLRECLERDRHVVVEGTQGFGLSLLHYDHFLITRVLRPRLSRRASICGVALSRDQGEMPVIGRTRTAIQPGRASMATATVVMRARIPRAMGTAVA